MKKKIVMIQMPAALIAFMAVFAACSGKTAQKAEAPAAYETLTFDNYGRELVIKSMPQRVLTMGPNCTELFVALGLADKVVGNSRDDHSRGPLPEYAAEYEKIPELTYGAATREAVLSSGADFIFSIDWALEWDGFSFEELAENGIAVYENSATTIEEVWQEIRDIGKIFRIESAAEAFIAGEQARIAVVEKKIAGREPLKVLAYDSGGSGVLTCSGINYETRLIENAGGKNIFDDLDKKKWMTISYEEILKRNPDVIVIHDYHLPSLEDKIKAIKNEPGLSRLDCVKNEKFVPLGLESFFPGSRTAYTIETLAKGFYPDAFKE